MAPLHASSSFALEGTLAQKLGLVILCLFPLASIANDFSFRLLSSSAYITTVFGILLPGLWLLSGNPFRSLRDSAGRVWILFLLCLGMSAVFSKDVMAAFNIIGSYAFHSWLPLVYIATFALTLRDLRKLVLFLVVADVGIIVDCILFGVAKDLRFRVPGSIFFDNPNDLSLWLLLVAAHATYLFFEKTVWLKMTGVTILATAVALTIRTGGRGAFVALIVFGATAFVLTKRRLRFAILALVVAALFLIFTPATLVRRLTQISVHPELASGGSKAERAALASQRDRMSLLLQSVKYAFRHPFLGLGPGQFATTIERDFSKSGNSQSGKGSHNVYTQLASECGIPALVLYVVVLATTLFSNYRIFRRCTNEPTLREGAALAYCLFASMLVYSVCTLFFSAAYNSQVPTIAGMTIVLRLVMRPMTAPEHSNAVFPRLGIEESREALSLGAV